MRKEFATVKLQVTIFIEIVGYFLAFFILTVFYCHTVKL